MNFEELGKKFVKFGQDTMTEVQKMNEVRQLNSRVSDEKKKLKTIYMEMGKKLYDLYKEAPLEGFETEIHAIEEKYSMIDLLQDQIRTVKGVTLCPCCNMEVNVGEHFCSNCGNKMPEVITIEENKEETTLDETETADEVVEDVAEEGTEDVTESVAEAEEEVVSEESVSEEEEEAVSQKSFVEAAKDAAEEIVEAAREAADEVMEAAADIAEDEKKAVAEAAEEVEAAEEAEEKE